MLLLSLPLRAAALVLLAFVSAARTPDTHAHHADADALALAAAAAHLPPHAARSIPPGAAHLPARFITGHRVHPRRHASAAPHTRGRALPPPVAVGGVELEVREQPDLARRLERRANGSIIALGSAQSTYIIPIAVGDPLVAYPVQLDTGSSDLFLASSLCGGNCPADSPQSPRYDAARHSASFVPVNDNQTLFAASYADGTRVAGFIAREHIRIGASAVDGQVFGLINATNLTLAEQKISGVIGFGFPRLSIIARALLAPSRLADLPLGATTATSSLEGMASDPGSSRFGAASASASASSTADPEPQRRQVAPSSSSSLAPSASSPAAAAAMPSSPYLPTLLESLVTTPQIPYPVFGLALAAPQANATATPASSSAAALPSMRFNLGTGSLTLGGVSGLYVSENATSGRTLADIEWWPVVPFSPVATARAGRASASLDPSSSLSSPVDADPSANSAPSTLRQLDDEDFLYWAVELANVAVNGTDIGVNSSYASIGIPSIALLDVGTNGIFGPQQDVARIFSRIKDARQVNTGQWAVPCETNVTIGFTFGGRHVELPPSDWLYAAVAGSSMCLAWPVAVPNNGDGIDWQLGTPFLRNVYTVFSYGINGVQTPQLGFLPLADQPSAEQLATSTPVVPPATPTQTLNTRLPNVLLPALSYPTPTYIFDPPPGVETGAFQNVGLANSAAYSTGNVPVIQLPSWSASHLAESTPPPPGWPGGAVDPINSSAAPLYLVSAPLAVAAMALLVLV